MQTSGSRLIDAVPPTWSRPRPSEVDRLLEYLPMGWKVVVQPEAKMGGLWGACWWFPLQEIWLCARDPDAMKASLVHEIGHARLPPGEGHSPGWAALCRLIWREVLGEDRPGFVENVGCHVGW